MCRSALVGVDGGMCEEGVNGPDGGCRSERAVGITASYTHHGFRTLWPTSGRNSAHFISLLMSTFSVLSIIEYKILFLFSFNSTFCCEHEAKHWQQTAGAAVRWQPLPLGQWTVINILMFVLSSGVNVCISAAVQVRKSNLTWTNLILCLKASFQIQMFNSLSCRVF